MLREFFYAVKKKISMVHWQEEIRKKECAFFFYPEKLLGKGVKYLPAFLQRGWGMARSISILQHLLITKYLYASRFKHWFSSTLWARALLPIITTSKQISHPLWPALPSYSLWEQILEKEAYKVGAVQASRCIAEVNGALIWLVVGLKVWDCDSCSIVQTSEPVPSSPCQLPTAGMSWIYLSYCCSLCQSTTVCASYLVISIS